MENLSTRQRDWEDFERTLREAQDEPVVYGPPFWLEDISPLPVPCWTRAD